MLVVYLIGAGIVAVLAYVRLTRRSRRKTQGLREEDEMRRQSAKAVAQIIRRSNDSVGSRTGSQFPLAKS